MTLTSFHFAAIFVIVALSALVFPIVYLLGVTHDVSSSIASIAFAIAALASLGILFGQKVLRILNISQAIRKIHTKVAGSKTAAGATYAGVGSTADDYAKLTTDEERFDYCRRQILEWQGRMLAVNSDLSATDVSRSERVSSGGGGGGGSSVSVIALGRVGLQDGSASQNLTSPSIAVEDGVIEYS
jgi:hypothetical protein